MKRLLPLLLAAALIAPTAPAGATILGVTRARSCFEAASRRTPSRDALRTCDSALQEDALPLRDRAATLVNRGILHMQSEKIDAALADYDAAIRIEPATAEAWVNKGIALIKVGRDAEAADAISHGLTLSPTNPAIAHYSRAFAYEAMGKVREAYEDFGRAAALAPGWTEPYEQLRRFKTVKTKTAGV